MNKTYYFLVTVTVDLEDEDVVDEDNIIEHIEDSFVDATDYGIVASKVQSITGHEVLTGLRFSDA